MRTSQEYWDGYVNQPEQLFFEHQDTRLLTLADIEQQVNDYVAQIPDMMYNCTPRELRAFARDRDNIRDALVAHLLATRGVDWDIHADE